MADTLDLAAVDLRSMHCPRCAALLPATVRFYGPCPDCVTALLADAAATATRNAPVGSTPQAGEDAERADDIDRPLQGQERAMNG